jgi:hypothetical protein
MYCFNILMVPLNSKILNVIDFTNSKAKIVILLPQRYSISPTGVRKVLILVQSNVATLLL